MGKEGYPVRKFDHPTKRFCQCLEISDDPELIRRYRECHGEECHWREVRDGIREVGIDEMEIYIHGNKVFMIVEAAEDFDWQRAMSQLASLPRQSEWEAYVAESQGCDPSATSDQKWQMMERMFRLYD